MVTCHRRRWEHVNRVCRGCLPGVLYDCAGVGWCRLLADR
ncbi:unnamed protein product [Pseudomonas synxantha]|nr:unnamed protein product [Pseudomonas synxantha]